MTFTVLLWSTLIFMSNGSCERCELVPCGYCQEGCVESSCGTDDGGWEPGVDKVGHSSRNGCANDNAGANPTKCRTFFSTPPPRALPCVTALPRAFHWDVEPHSIKSRWDDPEGGATSESTKRREVLAREWLDLINKTRHECLASSTTGLKLAADISMNYDLDQTWVESDGAFTGPAYVEVRYPNDASERKLLAEWVIPMLDIAVVMAYRDNVNVNKEDNILVNIKGEIKLAEDGVGRVTKIVAAVETTKLSNDRVTFFEEGVSAVESNLTAVEEYYAANASFGGTAIHDYTGYSTLVEMAKKNGDTARRARAGTSDESERGLFVWNDKVVRDTTTRDTFVKFVRARGVATVYVLLWDIIEESAANPELHRKLIEFLNLMAAEGVTVDLLYGGFKGGGAHQTSHDWAEEVHHAKSS